MESVLWDRVHQVQRHTAAPLLAQTQVSSALSRTLNPEPIWVLFGIVKEETFLFSIGHTCSRESIAGGMPGTEDQGLWEISWLFFCFCFVWVGS